MTGVNLIIDDTPETRACSRASTRCAARSRRVTLENLIADGRIHPARIEELFNKADDQLVAERVRRGGRAGLPSTAGIHDLHPELVPHARRAALPHLVRPERPEPLRRRSPQLCRHHGLRAGRSTQRLRQAGRACCTTSARRSTIEVEGPPRGHRRRPRAPLRRAARTIVHAIEAHHNDVEPDERARRPRPGGRRRLRRASRRAPRDRRERTSSASRSSRRSPTPTDGVERTYAMQAGREIRVMVEPEEISDAAGRRSSRTTSPPADRGARWSTPARCRVVVIRESRAPSDVAK